MSDKVLILGARGRFGRAATTAFLDAGWRVRVFVRPGRSDGISPQATVVEGDGFSIRDVSEAARGVDVIVNALNPPYHTWATDLPRITECVIAAAKSSGATVCLPGNVYNYGEDMPAVLTENTRHAPTTRKGRLRENMEKAYADSGVRTIVLRAGDFIEREKTGNWFDSQIAANVGKGKGKVMYPGPLDRVHSWAYLPDLARAMEGLASRRDHFDGFSSFGFAGYSLTGRELVDAMEQVLGHRLRVGGMPWPLVRLAGLVMPTIREVVEMRYLWDVPHAIDGAKLAAALPDFRPTPLRDALSDALYDVRSSPASPASGVCIAGTTNRQDLA